MSSYELTDAEWSRLEAVLPPRRQGSEREDDRLNGIPWVLRTRVPWRGLPEHRTRLVTIAVDARRAGPFRFFSDGPRCGERYGAF